MKFTYIVFAALVFGAILTGLGGFYGDVLEQYSENYTSTSDLANKSTYEATYMTNIAQQEMNSSAGGLGGGDMTWTIFGFILKSPIYIAKTFMSTGAALIMGVNTLTNYYVPAWVTGIIITAISFVIIMAVIRMVWNKEY